MSNPIGARKNSNFKAISTAPSFNKTPVGSATPPLPYATFQDLSNSVGVVPSVKFNGDPAYVLRQSTQPSGKGDAVGVAKGVKSGTVTGEVKPTKGSTTVNVGKQPIVRKGDSCTMNGGNNPGIFCTTVVPSGASPKNAADTSAPPTSAQTKPEQSMLDKVVDGARSAAKHYRENVSDVLHNAAADAMDKGGTIATAGGGAIVVGGGMALTGVGAAPGAVIAAGGTAVAAVGGGVSTVGGAVETFATGMDALADFAIDGKVPNVTGMATAYAERVIMSKIDKLTKFIPGFKAEAQAVKAEAKAAKVEVKGAAKTANNEVNARQAPPRAAGDGTTITPRRRSRGRCELRPYSEGCESGTPHHVVPDHCFKQPGESGAYYNGAIKHKDGLCICVQGPTKSTTVSGTSMKMKGLRLKDYYSQLADHGKIHARFDVLELALGARGDPKGTAKLGDLERAGASVVGKVTGCDAEDIRKQLRDFHGANGLGQDVKLRADPFGSVKNLDPSLMGKPRQGSGGSGR
ncbi:PAAR-like domain-containing protein [Massilia antarctica]|uniref:PAAR-like domain-containing protein n=1 Tax=Massilia antarctica TaxID=2765360 RepID=UPI0035E877A1